MNQQKKHEIGDMKDINGNMYFSNIYCALLLSQTDSEFIVNTVKPMLEKLICERNIPNETFRLFTATDLHITLRTKPPLTIDPKLLEIFQNIKLQIKFEFEKGIKILPGLNSNLGFIVLPVQKNSVIQGMINAVCKNICV